MAFWKPARVAVYSDMIDDVLCWYGRDELRASKLQPCDGQEHGDRVDN